MGRPKSRQAPRTTMSIRVSERERRQITIMVTLISLAVTIYFGDWIKMVLPFNLLFLLLFIQMIYVAIRWYVKVWREARGYY